MDRNYNSSGASVSANASLSARRAWIEIRMVTLIPRYSGSLSARRAWIEIQTGPSLQSFDNVALRKESVDRNL